MEKGWLAKTVMVKLAVSKAQNMPGTISKLSLHISEYKQIIDLLKKPIDISKLPVIAECKLFKPTAERYGHVIIKLDLETDENILRWSFSNCYSYEWAPETTFAGQNNIILPLDGSFEKMILNEISVFTTLLEVFNENTKHLRFSVIGGSFRVTERPHFAAATAKALIQLMEKLNEM